MDLYKKLTDSDDFINYFSDILEDLISEKNGSRVIVNYKKHDKSIFFFIDGSSILQVAPDKDLQYTYAHVPSYEREIQSCLKIVEKQYKRNKRIDEIIKKES